MTALRSVAALYDIHGNLPALDAVLRELEQDPPDVVVVGGDVAAGPMPCEVLDRLRALPMPVHHLRGNADRALVMCFDDTLPDHLREVPIFQADQWTARWIAREQRDFLDGLPPLLSLTIEGLGDVLFCHATARSDEERVTTATADERLARVLAECGAGFVVAGHTHRQFDRRAGGRRMVNAGSVGRPYEHEPGAYWLRLGPGVDLRRTVYDTEAATRRFRELGYPLADQVLAPVDADAVAARYEAMRDEPVAPESLIAR
jgi:predicted phosphodiesterase